MEPKKTLVIGASLNPERYSHLAMHKLTQKEHPVVAIGVKPGKAFGIEINEGLVHFDDVDTITLYVKPSLQKNYFEYILSLKPKRVIFNPGTENDDMEAELQKHHIETIEACTLVMLSSGRY